MGKVVAETVSRPGTMPNSDQISTPMVFNGRPGAKPDDIPDPKGPKKDNGNFFTNIIHKVEDKAHSAENYLEDKAHSAETFIKDIPHKIEEGIHVIEDDVKKSLDYMGNIVKEGLHDIASEAEKVALDGALIIGGVILGSILIMKLL